MPDVEVLVFQPSQAPGLVTHGATGAVPHAGPGEIAANAAWKVVTIGADKLADGVVAVAEKVGPTLRERLKNAKDVVVESVSIGFSIDVNGKAFMVGVGAQASVTVTFHVA
ncbi:MAG: hypothetical protein ACREFP_07645 [Acetobacteraceae bacterium]